MVLDDAEYLIVKQLIKNPRISDNQIAKNTKLSVMTVNRKRKLLESKGLISYFTVLNTDEEGLKIFYTKQLYRIKFKTGITKEQYLKVFTKKPNWRYSENIINAYLGEKDGRLSLILIVGAKSHSKLTDIFNGEIVDEIHSNLGADAIEDITTTRIDIPIRLFHNYMPLFNMEEGKIKEDWPDDYIFVDRPIEERTEKSKNKNRN